MMRGVMVLEAGHGARRVVGELGRVNPTDTHGHPTDIPEPRRNPGCYRGEASQLAFGDTCDIFHDRSGNTRRFITHFRWIGGYSL